MVNINTLVLVGRLTRDPEAKYSQNGVAMTRFNLAVNRRKQKDKPQEADFINCVAWGVIGENLSKYQSKGSQIAVHGRIQTRNYENKEGKRVYITEVVAEEIEFLGSKKDNQPSSEYNQDFGTPMDDFTPIDESDGDLPF